MLQQPSGSRVQWRPLQAARPSDHALQHGNKEAPQEKTATLRSCALLNCVCMCVCMGVLARSVPAHTCPARPSPCATDSQKRRPSLKCASAAGL